MEKVGALISRLQQQFQQQANESTLLQTALLLVTELQNRAGEEVTSSGTVSVIMPYKTFEIHANHSANEVAGEDASDEENDIKAIQQEETVHEEPLRHDEVEETEREELQPSTINTIVEERYNEVLETIPTLMQQPAKVTFELNETVQPEEPSVNDRMKSNVTETATKIGAEPIKDLRKAIGINDKYLFVRELFRNDETAYERSLKTINSFNILPEAEYWIQREMKYKLGWDDNDPTVQAFYQLVKRRFS